LQTTGTALDLLPYLLPDNAPGSSGAPLSPLALVWFGANDAAAATEPVHVPIAEYKANLKKVVEILRLHFAIVVIITPPPVHGLVKFMSCASASVYFIRALNVHPSSVATS
jgi:lysophospholipase L1-like esterase